MHVGVHAFGRVYVIHAYMHVCIYPVIYPLQVCCYSISAKNSVNIDITLDWLMKHTATAR